jgi:hypothetical protein
MHKTAKSSTVPAAASSGAQRRIMLCGADATRTITAITRPLKICLVRTERKQHSFDLGRPNYKHPIGTDGVKDEAQRRRVLIPMIKAELWRRAKQAEVIENECEYALVSAKFPCYLGLKAE